MRFIEISNLFAERIRSMPLSFRDATARIDREIRHKPALKIEKGARIGQVDLKEGPQFVGGDAHSDIVVLGLEPKRYLSVHLEISDEGASAFVEILAQGVRVGTKSTVSGEIISITSSDVISIGDTRLSVLGLNKVAAKPSSNRKLAAAMLFSAALGLVVIALVGPHDDSASLQQQRSPAALVPANVTMKEMRDAFRMAGLKLNVELDPNSAEVLVGDDQTELNLSEKEKLASIISVFSKRSGLPLVDRTKLTSGLEGLIAATALDPVKFVVGTDGKRYREGEILSQKWKIESIEPGLVKLSRDGKQDVITTAPFSDPLVLRLADRSNGKAITP